MKYTIGLAQETKFVISYARRVASSPEKELQERTEKRYAKRCPTFGFWAALGAVQRKITAAHTVWCD